MISVEKIDNKDIKYCANCDKLAKFKIHINNLEMVLSRQGICLCAKCIATLTRCLKLKE